GGAPADRRRVSRSARPPSRSQRQGIFVLLALEDRLARDGRVPRLLAYLVHWPGWPPGWDDPQPAPEARERPLGRLNDAADGEHRDPGEVVRTLRGIHS